MKKIFSFLKSDRGFYLSVLCVYALLSIVLIFFHEPWRDEAQAWLVARDNSFQSLIGAMQYEGSPALWHVCLKLLQLAGFKYSSMFFLHTLIATTALWIFLRYSPFNRFHKVLFAFGYFMFYEYNIIARSYVLSVLFLFLIAALYRYRLKKPLLYSMYLFFLSQTNTHSTLIASLFIVLFLIDLWQKYKGKIFRNVSLITSVVLTTLAVPLALFQIRSPDDLGIYDTWTTSLAPLHLLTIVRVIINAFLPLPFDVEIYDNPLFYSKLIIVGYAFIGVVVFLLALWTFKKNISAGFFFASLVTCLCALFFLKDQGQYRHHGLVFIAFLICHWVSDSFSIPVFHYKSEKTTSLISFKHFITGILILQLLSGVFSAYHEVRYPFSQSKKAAYFLNEERLISKDSLIIAYKSPQTSALLPYLNDQKSFYYLEYQEEQSYVIWNKTFEMNQVLSEEEIQKRILRFKEENDNKRIILIRNEKSVSEEFNTRYELIASFTNATKPDEEYFIYVIEE